MGERAPAFSFYARDFLIGTVTMSLAERGAYITLLAYQWDHGSVPDDADALGRIWGCPGVHAKKIWTAVSVKFQVGPDGLWRNIRLEHERTKQSDRRARLTANGKKGGRPPNQEETYRFPEANQNETKSFVSDEPTENHLKRLAFASASASASAFASAVQKDPPAESLSAPPTRGKQYGRIFVHPWQLHELIDALGPHAPNFGLDEWVFGLTAVADTQGLVLEKKEVWGWVQAQLMAEIKRRGLPVANGQSHRLSSAELAREVAIGLGIDPEQAGIPK